jgi:hypothetical protein
VTQLAPPDVPGPFGLRDADRTRRLLEGAGFRDVSIEPFAVDIEVPGGSQPEAAAGLLLLILPTRHLMRQADEDAQARARHAVDRALAPYRKAGSVRLPGAAWIVSACA